MGTEEAEILAAAWRVLERSRFKTLKIRQVLLESGVSANTFYRYFPSKSHLMVALIEEEMAREAKRLRERMDAAGSPVDRLRAWLEDVVAIGYDEHRAARARMFLDAVLMEELPHDVDRLRQMVFSPLVELIEQGTELGVFHSADPAVDAKAVYHMLQGFISDRLAGMLDWPDDQVVDVFHRFVVRSLCAPP